jgi:2,4-dienoyl-CoA reductase-like NADH-dependent reductase (Old Yellow Enzyme family)/thioredoxin reductase
LASLKNDVSFAMSEFPLLFQAGSIGRMRLRNRIVMAPIGTNLADIGGAVTPQLIDWYAERARGGVALVIVENALADARFGRGLAHQLRIDDPKFTPGLNELVETVHASGAKIAVQINIQGGGVDLELQPGIQPVGPSPFSYVFDETGPGAGVPSRLKQVKEVRALEKGEITELRDSFIRAAGIAKSAGFDAIEIHAAHGYLLAAFLSPATNKREDEYGGDLLGRMKFAAEVCRGIREAVGPEYPLLVRFSGREYFEGGREIDESLEVAGRLEGLGIHALHISAGITMMAGPFTMMNPPMSYGQGAFIEDAEAIKKAVHIPVIGVGKIRDPEFAEKLLEENRVDFIALGRTLVADPEWPIKALRGRRKEIRRCISCNRCHRIMARRKIRCALNARAGREGSFPLIPAPRRRRVAVIGGGPAGMEAARVASLRGHEVTLFEKERVLGGQLKLAMVPPFKKDLGGLLACLREQLKQGVEVQLEREIRPEDLLRDSFDVVILASGSTPPGTPRWSDPKVVRCWDVLAGKVPLEGDRIVVIGRSRVACETAELLAARRNKKIILLDSGPREEMGSEMEPIFERRLLMERLKKCKVEILSDTSVTRIDPEGLTVQGKTSRFIPCRQVVLDEPPLPRTSLLKELQGKMKIMSVGDCLEPGDLYKAIHEGFLAGYRIGEMPF